MSVPNISSYRVATCNTKTLRLFCLPHAAGSTRIFRGWHRDLPSFVEICPLELPGHGRRSREEPIGDLEPIMADLLPTVLRRIDKPFAILGYDYGALLAFELAHRLEHRYCVFPRHLFVAAMRAPVWPRPSNPVSEMPDHQFRDLLRGPNGGTSDLLELDSLMEYAIRVVRADFRVVDNYRYEYKATPSCPITAFRGCADPGVSSESLQAWGVCTKGTFRSHEVPGGHYFIYRAREQFLHKLSMELRAYGEGPPGRGPAESSRRGRPRTRRIAAAPPTRRAPRR
jgi:medium-chain acyl-[acyl-carrier-protein] hydrolase